jgi:hypothetical protein
VGLVNGDDHRTAYDDYRAPAKVHTWSDLGSRIWELSGRPPIGGWGLLWALILGVLFLANASAKAMIALVACVAVGAGAATLLWWRNRSRKGLTTLRGTDVKDKQ